MLPGGLWGQSNTPFRVKATIVVAFCGTSVIAGSVPPFPAPKRCRPIGPSTRLRATVNALAAATARAAASAQANPAPAPLPHLSSPRTCPLPAPVLSPHVSSSRGPRHVTGRLDNRCEPHYAAAALNHAGATSPAQRECLTCVS
jgi:hypothetical protein